MGVTKQAHFLIQIFRLFQLLVKRPRGFAA
jgi:hypothetical protein